MTIKLLCLDPQGHYQLIDRALLSLLGIETIFVFNSESKAIQFDNFVLVNSFEYHDLYSLCEVTNFDFVLSLSEDLFIDLAKIRRALDIPGMDLSMAMLLSHKNLMYEKLQGVVQCPRTAHLTKDVSFSSLLITLCSQEIFIKPINRSGSYETYHVKNEIDYQQFLVSQKEGLVNYIAQEYINSELYHAEMVVFDGEILFSSARKYTFPNHLMVSRNEPIFSMEITDQTHYETIIGASIKVQQMLGVNNGILHSEFFLTENGEVIFIETNARAPGIGLNRMYNKKLSVSLETLLCCIVCGVRPSECIEQNTHYLCGYYPLKPGKIKKIQLPQLGVANEWIVYVKPNESYEQAQHMTKSAMVICWDQCSQKIEEIKDVLVKHQVVELY